MVWKVWQPQPVAAAACSARPHDVVAGRELLRERIETLPRLRAIVGDRAYLAIMPLVIRSTSPGVSFASDARPIAGTM